MKRFACVVLAAGKGKRMKSQIAKVLHHICGKPMLFYVLHLAEQLPLEKIIVVVGKQKEAVKKEFADWSVSFVNQNKLLGTGDAVLLTEEALKNVDADVIVLAGDTPLLKHRTIEQMMDLHIKNKCDITLLSACIENPTGYGRIIRKGNKVVKIVEERDATEEQKAIKEINAGVYIFNKKKLFHYLKRINPNNIQKEYYLTDVIRFVQEDCGSVYVVTTDDRSEIIGINDRWMLARVAKLIRERMIKELMLGGVTFVSPESTTIDYDVTIGKDTVVEPFVTITERTIVGENCQISAHTSIRHSVIGDDVTIEEGCLISNATITTGNRIPAFSIVRDEKNKQKA
jgi:bifunctional UDP-N-acetylglucosamine pyrophosphorylase/glucosamine-1-phosphate N-acetyltransferase